MSKLAESVKKAIEENQMLRPGEDVIVAYSGGPDSTALLMVLEELGYAVQAAHVEHGIRGEESLADAAFAEKFCKERGIPFTLLSCDAPQVAREEKLSLEDAARRERYRLLQDLASKSFCRVAVAHHLEDQAETVLMHLLRGSGMVGLCGMFPVSNNVIRPFLDIEKSMILAYLEEKQLPYRIDSSNSDVAYARNDLRLNVIPALQSFRPDACERIADCARILRAWQAHEDLFMKALYVNIAKIEEAKVTFPAIPADAVTIYSLSRLAILHLKKDTADISGAHFKSVAALWLKPSGRQIVLPSGVHVRRSFENVEFYLPKPLKTYCYPFEPCRHYAWGEKVIKSRFVFARGDKPGTYLDFDALPPDTVLRTRQSGDRIHPLGAPGSMTLKKYFINKKVPQDERHAVPLLASGSEILAVFGMTVAERVKVTEQTKKILFIFEGEPT